MMKDDDSSSSESEVSSTGSDSGASPAPVNKYPRFTQPGERDEHAPEALVKVDNAAVEVIRVLVISVMLAAAILTSTVVYALVNASQKNSFEDGFENVASKITAMFLSDVSLKLWMAQGIGASTSLLLRATNATSRNLIFELGEWQTLSREARYFGNAVLASWNPLLNSDEERLEFESFASQTPSVIVGVEPECYVCGSPDRGYSNPNDFIDVAGFGSYPCSVLENSGRQGLIPEGTCDLYSNVASAVCSCTDLGPDTVVVENSVDVPVRLFRFDEESGEAIDEPYSNAPYLATWTSSVLGAFQPPLMYNQMANPVWKRAIEAAIESGTPIVSETFLRNGSYYEAFSFDDINATDAGVLLHYPVEVDEEVVGTVSFDIPWSSFMTSVFPALSEHVLIVMENSCGQNYTFTVDVEVNRLLFLGYGDRHTSQYNDTFYSSDYDDYKNVFWAVSTRSFANGTEWDVCEYRLHIFATQDFEDEYLNHYPIMFALVTGSIFLLTAVVFFIYDSRVAKRQQKLMNSANRTSAIVYSLFPKNVRARLLEQANDAKETPSASLRVSKLRMSAFLKGEPKESYISSEPIADLFASATVMFLDIAGFTAWSSEREPTQVFKLLENVYQAFDVIAKKLSVFKVETIGDSYVAVCGLPARREDHAIIMVQFAERCLKAMTQVTRKLEVILGPSTGDLQARVGLHSGPVTAGVLRGDKARFQLFGDTVNTASRMENTGSAGRIHASRATVELLQQAGRGHWAVLREDMVSVKGKGSLQTYWLHMNSTAIPESSSSQSLSSMALQAARDHAQAHNGRMRKESKDLMKRLVDWNVEVIFIHLERVVAHREEVGAPERRSSTADLFQVEETILDNSHAGKIVIDEMTEVLSMPAFPGNAHHPERHGHILDPKVKEELRDYIHRIAELYRSCPFHNFEHVSHVVMSASKLMNRIVNPDDINYRQDSVQVAKDIHRVTFGVSSDPILQFAVVFASLIHDVDHTGLTNAELIEMETPEAIRYRKKSVAEQNSVDVAWTMLMESRYQELRACIYTNEAELKRFRQAIVNAVMATDIADKELKQYREGRWAVAFPTYEENGPKDSSRQESPIESDQLDTMRKATIVFEYIIQASDVSHTMQHWYTYQKFNRRLFEERYLAWLNGHAPKDPSIGWYGGEMWFFDNYIIPLANKLDKCGVFGVSYDEYLTYAIENRKEWEQKGEKIVQEMKAECEAKYAQELAELANSRASQS
eukprot:Nitzschia sp. Nitz4//scaffold12_size214221//115151//118977//NITZ4_001505-RA/size214221-processed-gene-0.161-mRNA-1//-1//CDS//3329535035//3951//frame0